MIIRPPRADYDIEDLGPPRFRLANRDFERRDLQLVNLRGQRLECSHFRPMDRGLEEGSAKLPCVVYVHGNCSCRLEASDTLQVLLPRNITVFTLDLSGSGKSEGEYISLGKHEEQDLSVVVRYLREMSDVSDIAFWGRSMGAAASIFRAAQDRTIAGCVLDSPFSSLRSVARDLVNNGLVGVPDFMVDLVLAALREEILERASFDIFELSPVEHALRARAPVLFAVADDDDFVKPKHTHEVHAAWGGSEKRLVAFDGGHNGMRPRWFLEEAATFLEYKLEEASKRTFARMPFVALCDDARLSLPPPPHHSARQAAQRSMSIKAKLLQHAQNMAAAKEGALSTCRSSATSNAETKGNAEAADTAAAPGCSTPPAAEPAASTISRECSSEAYWPHTGLRPPVFFEPAGPAIDTTQVLKPAGDNGLYPQYPLLPTRGGDADTAIPADPSEEQGEDSLSAPSFTPSDAGGNALGLLQDSLSAPSFTPSDAGGNALGLLQEVEAGSPTPSSASQAPLETEAASVEQEVEPGGLTPSCTSQAPLETEAASVEQAPCKPEEVEPGGLTPSCTSQAPLETEAASVEQAPCKPEAGAEEAVALPTEGEHQSMPS